jgi:Na+/H+-dicarboxylate symporter
MCATSGAGNGKLSGASNFIPGFNAQSSFQCSVVGFFFFIILFLFVFWFILLSVFARFTPFGIFKLFMNQLFS